jgi:hypothetical protein
MWNLAGLRNFRASGEENPRQLKLLKPIDERRCISLLCRRLDMVGNMMEVQMDYGNLGALNTFVTVVCGMMKKRINRYHGEEEIMVSALRNIACDLEMSSDEAAPTIQRLRREVVSDLQEILRQGNWHGKWGTSGDITNWFKNRAGFAQKKDVQTFLQALCDISSDKCPFITCNGWLAMGPRCLKKGDFVTVVTGADVPYLIRLDRGHFRLVGEAYVHGVMDGQILKMPIAEEEVHLY